MSTATTTPTNAAAGAGQPPRFSALVIARLTFHEAARRRILLAALVLGLVFLTVFGVGFYYLISEFESQMQGLNRLEFNEVKNFLLMAGLYVVNFLTVMMTVLTSVDTLSGEISSGAIHTLVSKPIRRWEIMLGKWLGFAGMLTLYLLLMGGGVMLLVNVLGDYSIPNAWRALSMMWLNAMILLTVSLLGGAILSTLANGVLVFGLYGISFIGGWIEQIGSFLRNQAASQTAINIGIFTSLILPSEALWKRAAHELQSPLSAALGMSPFSALSVPSTAMIVYAVFYLLAMLGMAIYQFQRRDL